MSMSQHPAPLVKCFLVINIVSIIYVLSTASWLGVWVGIELNLYTFIFILLLYPAPSHSQNTVNLALIYFLVQAISSLLLVFAIILLINSFFAPASYLLLQISLIIKLGAAPFHFWVPWTVTNSSWSMTFWLLTMQKLAPLLIIYNINTLLHDESSITLSLCVIALSALLGGLLGLFQTRLQPLLAYSSINQTAWLILAGHYSLYFMSLYFIFYSLLIFLICFLMAKNHSLSPHLSPTSIQLPRSHKLRLLLSFIVLAGLPPTIIFFLKLTLFSFIFTRPEFFWLVPSLVLGALFSTFYYLQFTIYLLLPSLTTPKTTSPRPLRKLITLSLIVFFSGPLFLLLIYI